MRHEQDAELAKPLTVRLEKLKHLMLVLANFLLARHMNEKQYYLLR